MDCYRLYSKILWCPRVEKYEAWGWDVFVFFTASLIIKRFYGVFIFKKEFQPNFFKKNL
jgi:hypothetical protein